MDFVAVDLGMETKAAECQEWLMPFHFSHPPLRRTAIVSVENCSGSLDSRLS